MAQVKRRKVPFILLAVFLVTAVLVGGYYSQQSAGASESQPVDYSHKVHIDAGMECLYCHSNAGRSPVAGVPSVQKCIGCHQTIATDNADVQLVTEYWNNNEPIPWERVNKQPDFVYFSHQPHVISGLACEECHGDIGEMDLAAPMEKMDMGWCLDCHEQQHEDIAPHLWDCLVCHK